MGPFANPKKDKSPNPTNTSYFQSICWVVGQIFDAFLDAGLFYPADVADTSKANKVPQLHKSNPGAAQIPTRADHRFDMASNTTVDKQGKKEVVIQSTGTHKRRFTVTLTHTSSVQMLQPIVAFKAKTERILKKIKIKENDAVITTQANGWMVYKLVMHWICKGLVNYTEGHHALLVFGTFKGHLKKEVLVKLTENNISIIIGACNWLHEQNSASGCLLE